MSTLAAGSPICANPEIIRPIANFKPSVWGDRFANYEVDDVIIQAMQEQVEELKVVVRKLVFTDAAARGCSHQLKLIDAVQRLGVAYHFEAEIEQSLERVYATCHDEIHDDDGDLYDVALRFRLLRRHGYNISSDIFNQFKDASGDFKDSLVSDVSGLLSFYEATHLRVQGEKILDDALVFTTTHLESATTLNSVSSHMQEQITEALERPVLKTLERLGAPRYMSIYQDEPSHVEDLLKIAKLDFNLVQCSHKKELSELIRWQKDQNFEVKFPFLRDRMVEMFFWTVGIYFEPQYVSARSILTKMIKVATLMDDIYDAYGTFEELIIITEAIQSWDPSYIDELPDYLKPIYQAYLGALDDLEEEMIRQGRSYRVHYAREMMKEQSRLYFAEAKWLNEAYTPGIDEYLEVASRSVGNTLLLVMCLAGMGDVVTKETFEWVDQYPKILKASNVIFRIMDDIAGEKFEKVRGQHVASSVDCYMKQYGVSEQEALDVFNKQIVDLWKDINQEFLRPTVMPTPVLDRILNLTRVVDILYKKEDAFTQGGKVMNHIVTTMFIDPAPL